MTALVPPLVTLDPDSEACGTTYATSSTAERAAGGFVPRVDSWISGWDEEFSRKLGARGWLGMTIPKEYGGHGRSHLDRYVVTEELLAAGAPGGGALGRRSPGGPGPDALRQRPPTTGGTSPASHAARPTSRSA